MEISYPLIGVENPNVIDKVRHVNPARRTCLSFMLLVDCVSCKLTRTPERPALALSSTRIAHKGICLPSGRGSLGAPSSSWPGCGICPSVPSSTLDDTEVRGVSLKTCFSDVVRSQSMMVIREICVRHRLCRNPSSQVGDSGLSPVRFLDVDFTHCLWPRIAVSDSRHQAYVTEARLPRGSQALVASSWGVTADQRQRGISVGVTVSLLTSIPSRVRQGGLEHSPTEAAFRWFQLRSWQR